MQTNVSRYYPPEEPYNPRPRRNTGKIVLIALLIITLGGVMITMLGNIATPNTAFAVPTAYATGFVMVAPVAPAPTLDAQATVQAARTVATVAAITNAQVAQSNAVVAESNARQAVAFAESNATMTAIANASHLQLELDNLTVAKAKAVAQNDVAAAVARNAIESQLWLAFQVTVAICLLLGLLYTGVIYLNYLDIAKAHAQRTANNMLALPAPRTAIATQRTTQPLSKQNKSKTKPKRSARRKPATQPVPRHRMTHDTPPLQADIREVNQSSSRTAPEPSGTAQNRSEPPGTTPAEPPQNHSGPKFAVGEWEKIAQMLNEDRSATAICKELGGNKSRRLAQVRRVRASITADRFEKIMERRDI